MNQPFRTVGIVGRQRRTPLASTLETLVSCLKQHHIQYFIEQDTLLSITTEKMPTLELQEIINQCDLIIVIGGDGSFLQAAQLIVDRQLPLLGINRGRLGFLTDISPEEISQKIPALLKGAYIEEKRFLLTAEVWQQEKLLFQESALNEVVLLPGSVAHMIEFEIQVNNQHVSAQRADGLIVATPTGSTAYALSGGGPILHPDIEAVVLVPMFPHTLSSRPLVIDNKSIIKITLPTTNESIPSFSCDGFERHHLELTQQLIIRKKEQELRLIHPLDYNYFHTLRSKLKWEI